MWCGDGGWGWGMMFGGVMMLGFWGLIIGFAVWAVTRLTGSGGDRHAATTDRSGLTPLEVAERRYAGGEISREEFQRLREDLHGLDR